MDNNEKDEIKNMISFDGNDDIEENDNTEDFENSVIDTEDELEKTQLFEITEDDTEADEEELYEEELCEEPDDGFDDFEEEYNDEPDNVDYDEEVKEKPKSKALKFIMTVIVLVLIFAAVMVFYVTDTGFIGTYKRNFAHNFYKLTGIELMKEEEEVKAPETIENIEDYRAALEAEGLESGGAEVYTEAENTVSENTVSEETVQTEPQENVAEEEADREEIVIKEDEAVKYNTVVKSSKIIPYQYANDSSYSVYRKGIVCAATNYMSYIDKNGDKKWEMTTSVIDPILRTAGDYILIAQKNGRKLCLYDNDALIYDIDCEDSILTANLSENGDCVLVTTKDLYKGAIVAYNKSGKRIYAWSSGTDSVIDAAISPKSRNIAAALLNTDETVKSTIEIFDITKKDPMSETVFEDTILFDVEYLGDTIYAFGDNSIVKVKDNGKTEHDIRFDGMDINHYAYDENGNTLMLIDKGNVPTLARYNAWGKNKNAFTVLSMPDFISVKGGNVIYNLDRDVISGKANGRSLSKYTAGMDIHDLIMIDKDTFFIVYSNSLELVKMQ